MMLSTVRPVDNRVGLFGKGGYHKPRPALRMSGGAADDHVTRLDQTWSVMTGIEPVLLSSNGGIVDNAT